MTHICVDKLTIIGSESGLSHGRRQAIIRTNAAILGQNSVKYLSKFLSFLAIKCI